jgi:hypothetical protein
MFLLSYHLKRAISYFLNATQLSLHKDSRFVEDLAPDVSRAIDQKKITIALLQINSLATDSY